MQDFSSEEIKKIGEVLKSIFQILIPFILGYASHIMTSNYDKRDIRITTSQIVISDIKKTVEFTNKYLEGEVRSVVTDKLTRLNNWQEQFKILSPKLSKSQRKQFIKFYTTVSEIQDIQTSDEKLLNEFYKDRNISRGMRIGIHIPGRNSNHKEFVELMEELQSIDVAMLISELEKI